MLGKLMKYEIKATSRTFLLLYIAVLFLAIVNRIFYSFDFIDRFSSFNVLMNMMVSLFTFFYILMIIALFVAVTIVVIQRFYKNLFGDEGYLMFTLPVKSWQLIVSKMLVAAFWQFISIIVTIISILIMLSQPAVLSAMGYALGEMAEAFATVGFSFQSIIIEIILALVLSLIFFALPLYACIAIGQLWKKHRVLGAFLAYFGMNFAVQTITSAIIGGISVPFLYKIDSLTTAQSFESAFIPYFHTIMLIALGISVLLYVGYFFITKYIIDRKLDLE
ncbi:MAG: hypothetical protein LBV27_02875 [Oscillospiraceae bacterium]|jgi:hypothetical protein|nr:hypothetical protein [Oscillospiraceae bacterium]